MSDSEIQMNAVHLTKINKINHLGSSKMKINHIISESELDEAIPFTKQWKQDRKVGKNIKADAGQITADLKTWMKHSRLQNITIDQFKNFLDQKGLDPATVDSIAGDRTSGNTGVEPDAPLTSAEVKQYIDKAVRAAFQAAGPGTRKSRYARPSTPPATGAGNPPTGGNPTPPSGGAPDITAFVNSLTPQQKAALKARL